MKFKEISDVFYIQAVRFLSGRKKKYQPRGEQNQNRYSVFAAVFPSWLPGQEIAENHPNNLKT